MCHICFSSSLVLLVLKVCLCFFLLIRSSSTTSNSCILTFVSLLLSLYKWWNLRDDILITRSRWYKSWYRRLSLSTTLSNKSWSTSVRCVHYRHTCVFTHCWLLAHLKFASQWNTRWPTFTNATEICSNSFISSQILVWYIAELSLVLWIRETIIIEFIL